MFTLLSKMEIIWLTKNINFKTVEPTVEKTKPMVPVNQKVCILKLLKFHNKPTGACQMLKMIMGSSIDCSLRNRDLWTAQGFFSAGHRLRAESDDKISSWFYCYKELIDRCKYELAGKYLVLYYQMRRRLLDLCNYELGDKQECMYTSLCGAIYMQPFTTLATVLQHDCFQSRFKYDLQPVITF